MRKTIFTAIIASGFFIAPGAVLADELPEPGTECTYREAADTRREGITLEDGRIVQCLKDETNPRERVWIVTYEPELEEGEDEEAPLPDDEETDAPDDGPGDEPDDSDESDVPDEDTDDSDDAEVEDEDTEPSPKPTDGAESDEDDRETEEADTDETVKVEPVSGASEGTELAVTGGALTGLILGGLALLGGGGAAAYFARKRRP